MNFNKSRSTITVHNHHPLPKKKCQGAGLGNVVSKIYENTQRKSTCCLFKVRFSKEKLLKFMTEVPSKDLLLNFSTPLLFLGGITQYGQFRTKTGEAKSSCQYC